MPTYEVRLTTPALASVTIAAQGRGAAQDRPNVAERVLVALADERGPVYPKTLQRDLGLGRTQIARGLYALLIIGFAERGARHRSGRLWSLTETGRRAANVL